MRRRDQGQSFPSSAGIPVFAICNVNSLFFSDFCRRRWLCKFGRDICRQTFRSTDSESECDCRDCPRASSSTRRFAATPNARRASPRARQRRKSFRQRIKHESKLNFVSKRNGRKPAIKFQKSKPACRSAADQTAESNPRRPDECSRTKSACRWIFGPPCRGCKCSARANPRCRRD